MKFGFKTLTLSLLMGVGLNSFASSEAYMILTNGTVDTIKNIGPDEASSNTNFFSTGYFFTTYNLKTTKSHYIVDKNNWVYTLSENGFIFDKKNYNYKGKIKNFGGSFFTTNKDELHIVTKEGYLISHEAPEKLGFKKISVAGGNYFINSNNQLVIVRSDGSYLDKTADFSEKAKNIKVVGDNYFITKDNFLYSVGEDTIDLNGNTITASFLYKINLREIISEKNLDKEIISGGNYFFDADFNIHTVAKNGVVDQNILKRSIKVTNKDGSKIYSEKPTVIGSSYFSFGDEIVYQVADDGLYYELGTPDRKISITNRKE